MTRFIAALGDPNSNSGTGAETWGLWVDDPGPRYAPSRCSRDTNSCLLLKHVWIGESFFEIMIKDWPQITT